MFEKPSPLKPGDAVGIFLPASPVKEPFRSQGLQALQRLGFRPVEIGDVFEKNDFLARRPENAFEDLLRFLRDPGIKALWAGRGGYGSNHLYPFLSRLQGLAAKPLIASSDVSYLLWFMLERLHWVVFYGPMAYGALAEGSFDDQQTLAVLCQPQPPPPIPGKILRPGQARGIVSGGCLANFASLIGTPHQLPVRNRILLLEDVNERPFRLDRMIWQIVQAGALRGVRALVLGEFPGCFNDENEKSHFLERLQTYTEPLKIPVLYDLPLGHAPRCQTLPLGVRGRVDTSAFAGLILEESGVKA